MRASPVSLTAAIPEGVAVARAAAGVAGGAASGGRDGEAPVGEEGLVAPAPVPPGREPMLPGERQ
ncbi:MAG TPA: hypothetical protein VGR80_11580, partial [Steroidobacteraceae bacterium]|nr:hypothetical protein [Steroidobacteraceae bacterium]